MAKLERSLTNMDWLISCARPIKSKSAEKHFCGKCVVCSRVRSRRHSAVPSSDAAAATHDGRPTHSYARLISDAIQNSRAQKLTLAEIYSEITRQYPYFLSASPGWKNSIRHNLSLNKMFKKVPRPKGKGKGCYWEVDANSPKNEDTETKRRRPLPTANRNEAEEQTTDPEMCIPYQYPCCQGLPYPPTVFPPPPPQDLPPFLPITQNPLSDSFRAFYRSKQDASRQEEPAAKRQKLSLPDSDSPLSALKLKMNSLARGTGNLSDIDVSSFEQLVASINPADKQKEQLCVDFRESFSQFLRELTTSGTKNVQPELTPLSEHFSSNEPSSQDFDWNTIL